MAFLVTLVLVYFAGVFWPKLVVPEQNVPLDWKWPIRLGKVLYNKIKG